MYYLLDTQADFALAGNLRNLIDKTVFRSVNKLKPTVGMPKLKPLPVKPRRNVKLIPGKRVRATQGTFTPERVSMPRLGQPQSFRSSSGFADGLINVRARSKYGL